MQHDKEVYSYLKGILFPLVLYLSLTLPASEASSPKYSRKEFHHWVDRDHNCRDTRQETLIRDGKGIVLDSRGCAVLQGTWVDPYTGALVKSARDIDIDHIVPLEEAFWSGASKWSPSKREDFANDGDNVLSVSYRANRQKGSKDPAKWLPSNKDYLCTYIHRWVLVKSKYGLSMDPAEKATIEGIRQASCSKQ